jgi:signal transduction histidine kinase
MTSDDQSLLREEASGFEVLADALPRMIQEMARPARPGQHDPQKQLGGITSAVAEHLRAEICSIFLLQEIEGVQKLVLQEAYGYAPDAIGTPKDLQEGLTARIVNERIAVLANFCVQDVNGWAGQLDKLLRGYGWCLLGVPIIGSSGTVRGVVKVENKRPRWSSRAAPAEYAFIRTVHSKNTPELIHHQVEQLIGKIRQADGDLSSLVQNAMSLSRGLLDLSSQMRWELQRQETPVLVEPVSLESFSEQRQLEVIESLAWHVDALGRTIRSIESTVPRDRSLRDDFRNLLILLDNIRLALDMYRPFSVDDYHLMRTVAAMIAAALDIREATHIEAFRVLEHAFKSPGIELLMLLCELFRSDKANVLLSAMRPQAIDAVKTALYISGPHMSLKGMWGHRMEFASVRELYASHLQNRFAYYADFAELAGKGFRYPDIHELSSSMSDCSILFNPAAVTGALDIFMVNAVQWGGDQIWFTVQQTDDDFVELSVNDDGNGFSDKKLRELAAPGDLYSSKASLGLRFAKRALVEAGMDLLLGGPSSKKSGAIVTLRVPTEQYCSQIGDSQDVPSTHG